MNRSWYAAESIHNGAPPHDVLRGPKVNAFWRNLSGEYDHVTIDVWAARAALTIASKPLIIASIDGVSRAAYSVLADAYRYVANKVGEHPAATQAIVWCAIRGRAD